MKSGVLNQSCSISKLLKRHILPDRSKDEKSVTKKSSLSFSVTLHSWMVANRRPLTGHKLIIITFLELSDNSRDCVNSMVPAVCQVPAVIW